MKKNLSIAAGILLLLLISAFIYFRSPGKASPALSSRPAAVPPTAESSEASVERAAVLSNKPAAVKIAAVKKEPGISKTAPALLRPDEAKKETPAVSTPEIAAKDSPRKNEPPAPVKNETSQEAGKAEVTNMFIEFIQSNKKTVWIKKELAGSNTDKNNGVVNEEEGVQYKPLDGN